MHQSTHKVCIQLNIKCFTLVEKMWYPCQIWGSHSSNENVFWVVISCSLEKSRWFEGAYCLHHHGQTVSRTKDQQEAHASRANCAWKIRCKSLPFTQHGLWSSSSPIFLGFLCCFCNSLLLHPPLPSCCLLLLLSQPNLLPRYFSTPLPSTRAQCQVPTT
jgi:hypothetical protein